MKKAEPSLVILSTNSVIDLAGPQAMSVYRLEVIAKRNSVFSREAQNLTSERHRNLHQAVRAARRVG
jgi:predicted metal-dependent enzyme (double-stranded beta helix superfamily)